MPKHDRDREEWRVDGGAEYIREDPGDQPGPLRGPGFLVVAILGFLSLLLPVAWGVGALATVGRVIGDAALVGLWIVWAIVVILFAWSAWGMWRRAA